LAGVLAARVQYIQDTCDARRDNGVKIQASAGRTLITLFPLRASLAGQPLFATRAVCAVAPVSARLTGGTGGTSLTYSAGQPTFAAFATLTAFAVAARNTWKALRTSIATRTCHAGRALQTFVAARTRGTLRSDRTVFSRRSGLA